ncbi:DUF6571 family protein [Streptomyces wuyuanensis]|uniref:DUF6571 family protein n=1 Tax=Streptomyces wuyuanensis TaxID=1196353 RepID=UPI0034355DAE
MSNLMRWGNFDDRFLTDYGTELINAEKKFSRNGEHTPMAWQHMGMDPFLNRVGADFGSDPMTGFLKGLSNSPDAATEFFNSDFVTKDDDHGFKTKDANGKEVKDALTNFDYLFQERDWPKELGEDNATGRNNLALALEAATTGHPAGELPTRDTPPHTPAQAALMERLVTSISDDPGRLTDHKHMADSVGQIAAEYLPDINRGTADDKFGNADQLFPIAGTPADLSHSDVTRFLVSVGQSPEGYAAVEVSQKAYMANLMDYHLSPDLPADHRYPHSQQETITEISRRSAEVGGTLAVGRQEAVVGPAGESAKDFADSVAQRKNAWSGAIGTGIGVGVSFIATPIGGAIAGGVAGTASSMVLEHVFQQAETDVLKDAGKDAATLWDDSKDSNVELSQRGAMAAAEAHKSPHANQVAEWARIGTADGFSDASDNTRHMAHDLETEIQPG